MAELAAGHGGDPPATTTVNTGLVVLGQDVVPTDETNKNKNKDKKRRKKKKRPPHKSKMVTGYIIYASEIRKDIIKKYPNRDFGDISKIVGVEWKNLPQETKIAYEKRAQEQNAKSKIAAAEALELKLIADAAEERSREQQLLVQQNQQQILPNNSINNNSQHISTINCNGYIYQQQNITTNGHIQPINQHLLYDSSLSPSLPNTPDSSSTQQMQFQHNQTQIITKTPIHQGQQQSQQQQQQQTPFHIVQQQQQPIATTVQYCSTNYAINNFNNSSSQQHQSSLNSPYPSQSPNPLHIQYQRNNIVYRKPTNVRLKPRDSMVQTDPIVWRAQEPKKPLKFSEKFIQYLQNKSNHLSNGE